MSDYLFDKEGEPDPEVVRLEGLLGPLAYRGAAPRLPARRSRRTFVVAAALTAAAAAVVALVIARPWKPVPPRWAVGGWIETEGAVRLTVAELGSVELAPHTRARVAVAGPERHELELGRGTVRATIAAAPRRFVVRTPHAVVTDLGCAFEVTVDEAGRGHVVVTEGRVAVASDGAPEIVVAAGGRAELAAAAPTVQQPATPAVQQPIAPTIQNPAAPAPTPTPALAPIPASPPSSPKTQPPHHAAHPTGKPAAAAHNKPGKTAPPAAHPAHAQPANTPKPAPTKMEHDSLKGLPGSLE